MKYLYAYQYIKYFKENEYNNVIPIKTPDELPALLQWIGGIDQNFVIVTGDSDFGIYPTNDANLYDIQTHHPVHNARVKFPDNIKKIYSINCCVAPGDRFVALPWGACHGKDHKDEYFYDTAKNSVGVKKKFCYMNFGPYSGGRNGYRYKLIQTLRRHSWIEYEPYPIGQYGKVFDDATINYLVNLGESFYTVAPEGDGPDSYRVWESLTMGCIPVVNRSVMWDHYDLPIFQVDDLMNLTEETLKESLPKFQEKWCSYNWNQLKFSYWIDRIKRDADFLGNSAR